MTCEHSDELPREPVGAEFAPAIEHAAVLSILSIAPEVLRKEPTADS